mgnify:CR=1 FL=1
MIHTMKYIIDIIFKDSYIFDMIDALSLLSFRNALFFLEICSTCSRNNSNIFAQIGASLLMYNNQN